jgi:hypothetical protein
MSNPVSPSQPAGPAQPRSRWPGADIRIGDAERTEVADLLARHFSDGRLDEAEFGDRLDRAMKAKTGADLVGLLSDLPGDPPPPQPGGRHHQRKLARAQLERERLALKAEQRTYRKTERELRWRSMRWLALLVSVIVLAMIVARVLAHSVGVWIVIGVIAFLWLRRTTVRSQAGERRPGDPPD